MAKTRVKGKKSSAVSPGFALVTKWLAGEGMAPFPFQSETWEHMAAGRSGIVNAPTGCGKTFSVFLGAIIQFINQHPDSWQRKNNGLQLLWITPLRALAKDIGRAMQQSLLGIGMPWQVGVRNGDTSAAERASQRRRMPEVLIITPESLQLLLATANNAEHFSNLQTIAVDEWHELVGGKRGVQVELALSYIIHRMAANLHRMPCIWGISATIGNLTEATEVLHFPLLQQGITPVLVKAKISKEIAVHPIIPEEIEKYPWAGHLGIKLAHRLVPIIEKSKTTLIFINTRGMAERWYQTLLDVAPQFSGAIALHHGSIEQELRQWVEEALHTETLKVVVTTASLDLGVDFRPVDTVIQVGSPKGVARFLQRAGRAGHSPGETSHIYFLPTHSLELVEAAALTTAIDAGMIESRDPLLLCFDVLIQFLCTIAVGEGFAPDTILPAIKNTYCFADMQEEEWQQTLIHLLYGGHALEQYDDYKKLEKDGNGIYRIRNRRLALQHRMNIGTIVSEAMMKVKMMQGGYVGHIEEYFISRLEPGDVFTLAGRNLELVQLKDMTVLVRKSNSKKTLVPSWMGGRMSLTANLGKILRETFDLAAAIAVDDSAEAYPKELQALKPLFQLQNELSHVPASNELLIEHLEDRDGYHLMVYPFEGRQVHEAMSAILAWRLGKLQPITFSIAMNDYGFELLSDQPIPLHEGNVQMLFSTNNLLEHMQQSINQVEMAKRKFRDIAVIGGLVAQTLPGGQKKARHLQSSSSLLFKVFAEFDSDNLLLRQAYQEVFREQMEEVRLRMALQRIGNSRIIINHPKKLTPLSFPIIVDGLNRNNLSSEKLEERIKRMATQLSQ